MHIDKIYFNIYYLLRIFFGRFRDHCCKTIPIKYKQITELCKWKHLMLQWLSQALRMVLKCQIIYC